MEQAADGPWRRALVTALLGGALLLPVRPAVATPEQTATAPGETAAGAPEQPTPAKPTEKVGALKSFLFVLLVLVIVFAVASYAIVIFGRRYREYLAREPAEPTADEDVWHFHRPPDDPDELLPPPASREPWE